MRISIKAARINVGLNQKEAAAALHVTPKTLGSWEKGVTKPSTKYIAPICELYRVTYNDIEWAR